MVRKRLLAAVIPLALVAFFAAVSRYATAQEDAPEVPAADDVVLEKLAAGRGDPESRATDEMRRRLAANPTDLRLATRLARRDIELSRARSDPRYLGHAEAALAPWYKLAAPPYEVLLLRATIRQSNHDFDAALADLAAARAIRDDDPQLHLTRAVILTVRAEYAAAGAECARVRELGQAFPAAVCDAGVLAVTGHAKDADARLGEALASLDPRDPRAPSLREWALGERGEIAMLQGDARAAEGHFREALAIDPNDAYVVGALADLLIDEARAGEVPDLVGARTENDALLLRLVIAERNIPGKRQELARDAAMLRGRYEASILRGDVVHRREQARFALVADDNAERALRLARDNYEVQREVADARILLEAAKAAGQPDAADKARAWVRESHVESPRLRALAGVP